MLWFGFHGRAEPVCFAARSSSLCLGTVHCTACWCSRPRQVPAPLRLSTPLPACCCVQTCKASFHPDLTSLFCLSSVCFVLGGAEAPRHWRGGRGGLGACIGFRVRWMQLWRGCAGPGRCLCPCWFGGAARLIVFMLVTHRSTQAGATPGSQAPHTATACVPRMDQGGESGCMCICVRGCGCVAL